MNGFVPRSPFGYRCYNACFAAALITAVLPLILAIAFVLLVRQGRPILYRGARLGLGGMEFSILKFRTLDAERAAALTRDRVLPAGTGIETPFGLFLRETRLDELPQLFNVLLGDMNICGPRPVRPAIAALGEAMVPNYGLRFGVKPGLLGPTQAFMSHGTPKAVRARLNNALCRSPVSYRGELGMVLTVASCVLARTLFRLAAPALGRARRARADLAFEPAAGRAIDVVCVDAGRLVLRNAPGATEGRLVVTLPDGTRRFATLTLVGTPVAAAPGRVACEYRARGALSEHVLSRYVFRQVVVPHRSQLPHRRLIRAARRRGVAETAMVVPGVGAMGHAGAGGG